MKYSLVIVVLTGIILIYFAANKALRDIEENRCDMTYMFEYPENIKVNLKEKISKQYPRYNLYIYGEGEYANEIRNFKLNGIPVLFIPGNAGSHRQVRSFASVALRKAETKTQHFNYFTVDFDEDFGGLFGGVLKQQANFVHSCLKHIINMYKSKKHAPDSVVVIGHSMGGVIAKSLYTLQGFQSKLVHLIITLGTPHVSPVIPLDPQLTLFYNEVNHFWQNNLLGTVNNVSIMSFSGGVRDILVPSKLSSLDYISSTVLHHSAVTTAVPHVWLSIDHLALCWCKQLVLVINRALFDLVDKKTGQIMKTRSSKVQVFKKYFGYLLNNNLSNGDSLKNKHLSLGVKHNQIILNVGQQYLIEISKTTVIPTGHYEDNHHFVAITKSVTNFAIFACDKVENGSCTGVKDFNIQVIPTHGGTARFVNISPHVVSKSSHIILKTSKSKFSPSVYVQFITGSSVNRAFQNPGFFTNSFMNTDCMFTNITLPMVRNNFDVFLITVSKTKCEDGKSGIFSGRVHIPWFNEDVYAHLVNSYEFKILLKLHTSRPLTMVEIPQLHIWSTDRCSLEVNVRYQFKQTLGQLFKMSAVDILKWVYCFIVVIAVLQIAEMSRNGDWIPIQSCVLSNKMVKILFLFALVPSEISNTSQILMSVEYTTYFLFSIMYEWLLPKLFLIFTAFHTVITLHLFIKLITTCLSWLLLRCSRHNQEEKSLKNVHSFVLYFLLGVFIVGLCFLSSSISMYFLTIILFLHMCKMAKELRQLTTKTSQVQCISNHYHFSETLLLFFVIVSLHTVPSFISWLKVWQYSWSLSVEPFFPLVFSLTPFLLCFFQSNLKRPSVFLSWILLLVWFVGFELLSLDKLPFFTAIIFVIICFCVFCKDKEHLKTI